MLPRSHRLRRKEEIDRVFREGRSLSAPEFAFKFLPNNSSLTRVAVLVGKKLANKAAHRNRIQRRLREVLRLNFDKLPAGYDLLVIARDLKLREIGFTEIQKKFLELLQKWTSKNS